MKKLNIVLSLTTRDNDYQIEQATAAQEAARRLGAELLILDAQNDPSNQSQQILKCVQAPVEHRPDAVIFEPVGTALAQVARASAQAGIGWVVLNREVDYLSDLRRSFQVPSFAISTNHEDVGRIQGRQMAALLPQGGTALYIQGPSGSDAAQQRTNGMMETKPANIQIRAMKAQWTEQSATQAVNSWLRLAIAKDLGIGLVAAQDDSMALGARKAFEEHSNRDNWLSLPYIGCDGMPNTGQAWVRRGLLAATVVIPPNAGQAIEMLAKAIDLKSQPLERSFTTPTSYPPLGALMPKR
ncbi:monosaccharide ABC transporter substrate-binding protein, CUT2 family [Candidatus Koribacter versatilis Ellin345]|uniref:Monosaccharide ABC transporter substrate-binding protein, CUT2 family n=1 Tax=Koribacter versatilis (strain Ellin345) TaxID=204669 RepID=Q1IJE8_KORVE|nr:substrate-binding domain-containing protein [Candidatus Koribacter versatilis]ABF43002.1 monosaccharide ABC transporter substrate-binding protein, CUT2 family [Candidatus Koribacter versatilis Ellin345]